jgi:hypothetical protein
MFFQNALGGDYWLRSWEIDWTDISPHPSVGETCSMHGRQRMQPARLGLDVVTSSGGERSGECMWIRRIYDITPLDVADHGDQHPDN